MAVTLNANSSTGFIANSDTSGVLQLQTGGTTAVTVDASQNVTLAGTLTATGVTTVQAGTVSAPAITTTGDTNTGIYFPAADTIAFTEGGVEAMRINSSANVGIGTDSPLGKLAVVSSSGITGYGSSNSPTLTVHASNRVANQEQQILTVFTTDNPAIDFGGSIGLGGRSASASGEANSYAQIAGRKENATNANYAGYLQFSTSDSISDLTERMRIDSGGNLSLGGVQLNNARFSIRGDTNARIQSQIVENSNAGSSSRCGYIVNAFGNSWAMEMGSSAANSNALNWTVDVFGTPTVRMALTTGGAATNSTGSWGTISDIRLKENVVEATPKLDGLMQLRVVNYNLKTDPDVKMLGFVAQEVEQVFPGLVDNDGEATGDGDFYKSVKTTVLVPMLVKAIQEQQALITQLQADVAALKGAST
jgi:hypothetical protein